MARAHGTVSCYKGGCRRDECREAHRKYQSEYRRRRAYGRPTTTLIDAEPAREHVRALLDAGMSAELISKNSGVNYQAIMRLLYSCNGRPPSRRIDEYNATRLLAVPVPSSPLSTMKRIDGSGSRRRAQALALLGWSVAWQARQIGMIPGDLHELVRGTAGCSARTARLIRGLYAKYWNRIPEPSMSSTLSRRAAERKGWLPPLAWDDDLIDLPDADLQAELSRRTAAMDSAELHRCYRASLEGDRSPLIVAAAEEYLARRREKRTKTTAA